MYYISIITPTFNSEKTISSTLDSILSQNIENYEYIVIDGGSTDQTLEIIKKKFKKGDNLTLISEPDHGIYDAMNKGISLAKGKIISILNSDDVYHNKNVLFNIIQEDIKTNYDILYGNTLFINSNKKYIRNFKPGRFEKGNFFKGWFPPHPSTFIKKKVYKKIGNYKIDIPISADFEFLLRAFELDKFKIKYLDQPLVIMMQGGESTKDFRNIVQGIRACKVCFERNKLPINNLYYFYRLMYILKQFFKR